MKYDLILLDLDNTLTDFSYSESIAFKKVLNNHGVTLTKEIFAYYTEINVKLWEALERGEVTKEYVFVTRFSELFKHLNVEGDAYEANKLFQALLCEHVSPFEGAHKTCMELAKLCEIAIVTNGPTIAQRAKLKNSGFDKIFEHIFISEDIGHYKPAKGFFDAVFNNLGEYNKDKVLIVGDSLSADIVGGNNYGIHTCWLNHKNAKAKDIECTYEISNILELLNIIK